MIRDLQWISTHFGRAGLETSWELGNYVPGIHGFIVVGANQIANFEMKTTGLISKFDSKFANFASKLTTLSLLHLVACRNIRDLPSRLELLKM
jgi:hypothetical protein